MMESEGIVNWLKRHALIISMLFLYFSSISIIYVVKNRAKDLFMKTMIAKAVIDISGKKCPKIGTATVKALFNKCPSYPAWAELVAEVHFMCDTKTVKYECRAITRKDFYVNDDGLVIR